MATTEVPRGRIFRTELRAAISTLGTLAQQRDWRNSNGEVREYIESHPSVRNPKDIAKHFLGRNSAAVRASDSNTFYWQNSDFTSRVASADDPFASADAGVAFRDGQSHLAFPKEISSHELHLYGDIGNATALFGVYRFQEESPVDLKGNPFPTLPKVQFSASLVATRGPFELVTTASWIGERAGSIWNIPLDEMPAYSRWDARLGWRSQDGRLRVTGFVDNILDRYGVTENEARGWDEDFIREGQLTDGRIAGLEVRFGF